MPKLFCLTHGHRFRVVQHFGPSQRRLKCERCGGDWGMHDGRGMIVPWCLELQQIYRDFGYEILEPLPARRSVAVEPLTGPEWHRVGRWPGALAMALGYIASLAVGAASFGVGIRFIAFLAVACVIMRLLIPGAYRRVYERKCNSLEA